MKLAVSVLGREVATLEQQGDFRSVLAYHPDVAPSDFVSLTMPVRVESYVWDDSLHPIFQMNLPEGYLLQVLQEEFGPHVGASPTALLSIVGRNMVGRLQVAAQGAKLDAQPGPLEIKALLQGDNSEQAFAELVRAHSRSGVSGVVPKFLDKATLISARHIIKGSSSRLPFVALNEHLCMQVAARVAPTARTEVSADGQALVVHRFDLDAAGMPHRGMEDFCALLGLRPANKYETTWERIARAVRDHVPGALQRSVFQHLTTTLLLTYALRNSDCHSKNVALTYTSRADVVAAPVFDMLTTTVYAGYQHNPPGISFMGKKTWLPGHSLKKFITATFGIEAAAQQRCVEQISDAVSEVAPRVREAMTEHPAFRELGKHMLLAWQEGVSGLCNKSTFAMPGWKPGTAFEGFSTPRPRRAASGAAVGESALLGKRRKKR